MSNKKELKPDLNRIGRRKFKELIAGLHSEEEGVSEAASNELMALIYDITVEYVEDMPMGDYIKYSMEVRTLLKGDNFSDS